MIDPMLALKMPSMTAPITILRVLIVVLLVIGAVLTAVSSASVTTRGTLESPGIIDLFVRSVVVGRVGWVSALVDEPSVERVA